MSRLEFFRLLWRHKGFIILFPSALATLVFLFVSATPEDYVSTSMIYTGFVSGYNIERTGEYRVDYHQVKNSFDNLIHTIESRQTRKTVSVRLLARHLLQYQSDSLSLPEALRSTLSRLPRDNRQKWVIRGSPDATAERLRAALKSDNHPRLVHMVYTSNGFYSIRSLEKIKAKRVGDSDILELSYENSQPLICQQTLDILIDVVLKTYKSLKEGESSGVLGYFKTQVKQAQQRLTEAENKLRTFRESYGIVNYFEQTKSLTIHQRDLETEVLEEKKKLNAARASITRIEEKLDLERDRLVKSREMLDLRNRLAEIEARMAEIQFGDSTAVSLQSLLEEEKRLRDQLHNGVEEIYQINYSTEGIPHKEFLTTWLNLILDVDASESRLTVIRAKQDAIGERFHLFAPLGSRLKQYERQVDVAEREYLELLHSLNLSKLWQRNIEFTANMKVLDAPNYPLQPQASNKHFLLMVTFLAGGCLALGIVILLYLLDTTIRTPKRAEHFTGRPLAGALAVLQSDTTDISREVTRQSLDHIIGSLDLALNGSPHHPAFIPVVSFKTGEGKTTLIRALSNRMADVNRKTESLEPDTNTLLYLEEHLKNGQTLDEAFAHTGGMEQEKPVQDQKIRFLEVPPLFHTLFPVKILEKSTVCILLVDAQHSWEEADRSMLNRLQRVLRDPPLLILNRVRQEELEDLIGERSNKSRWHCLIKRLVQFRFMG